jgi:hypothetical protein
MKKIILFMITMLSTIAIQAQLVEAQIASGTTTIQSAAGNIAEEGGSSNIALNGTSSELFTFTKTGETYTTTIEGNAATVAVWAIQTASGNYLQLNNITSSSTRLKHRAAFENAEWYILEGNNEGTPFYIINTAHTNHEEGEKTIIATSSDDFLNTQTITSTRTHFTLSGLTRTGPILNTNDFDTSSIFISNPVNSEIIIKGLDKKVNKIEVFNLVGKSILEKNVNGISSLRIEANSLTSGLYFVKFYSETSTFSKKIIKR